MWGHYTAQITQANKGIHFIITSPILRAKNKWQMSFLLEGTVKLSFVLPTKC